jgi:hypothetical protein
MSPLGNLMVLSYLRLLTLVMRTLMVVSSYDFLYVTPFLVNVVMTQSSLTAIPPSE